MMDLALTKHASKRMQQRGVPAFVVDLLYEFGSRERAGGAETLFFDKAARKRLRTHMGGRRGLRHIDPWLNTYAIVGDNGNVVTLAHSTGRRIR